MISSCDDATPKYNVTTDSGMTDYWRPQSQYSTGSSYIIDPRSSEFRSSGQLRSSGFRSSATRRSSTFRSSGIHRNSILPRPPKLSILRPDQGDCTPSLVHLSPPGKSSPLFGTNHSPTSQGSPPDVGEAETPPSLTSPRTIPHRHRRRISSSVLMTPPLSPAWDPRRRSCSHSEDFSLSRARHRISIGVDAYSDMGSISRLDVEFPSSVFLSDVDGDIIELEEDSTSF